MRDIYTFLGSLGIDYEKHDHPAVYTCEQADKYYSEDHGGRSKNLFLRNKKGNAHYLVILESKKRLNLKTLAYILDEDKLSFASEERMMKHLKITPGAVSPFALINNENNEVEVIVDEDLLQHEKLHYHPNVNTATLVLSSGDFVKFLASTGNPIRFEKL